MSVRVIVIALVALLLIYFFGANVRDAWGVHQLTTIAASDCWVDANSVTPDSRQSQLLLANYS